MRSSAWTPSLVPNWADQTVYIVENDFGHRGRAYVETDGEYSDLEATITGLLEGQYSNPLRIVAFNTAERGRRTCRKMSLKSYGVAATCSFATSRPRSKTSSNVTRPTIASLPCGWCELCPSRARSRR